MALYGLLGTMPGRVRRRWRRPGVLIIAALVVVIAVPLTATSVRLAQTTSEQDTLTSVVTRWATPQGWSVASITAGADKYTVRVIGPPPEPDTGQLHTMLRSADLGDLVVELELIPERRVILKPGGG